MRKRIYDHIDNCIICLTANSSHHLREGEMQICNQSISPFEVLQIDNFGPLQQTENGLKHILVLVDSFTRFIWLFPTKSTGSKEVINHLKPLFNVFGYPKEIVSDRGTAFASNKFTHFLKTLQINCGPIG